MEFKGIILAGLAVSMCLVSCTESEKINAEPKTNTTDTLTILKEVEMKSYISMFEIPATDISRAINFYQAVLDISIEKMDVEGMQMGIFPYEGQVVSGVIIQADGYTPSADGVTMYLSAGEDLQVGLNKVENNGGQIILPKTAHADESGYYAIILDSEGNRVALNSPN